MKTILLLGGKSKRFWPLGEKPLLSICGQTLAGHQVERLRGAGLTDILVVARKENLPGLKKVLTGVQFITQLDDDGMHAALLAALPKCKNAPVLIVGGNDVVESSAYTLLTAAASRRGVDGAMLGATVKRYFPGGYLTVRNGRITGILEKPGEGREPGNLVTIVAHVHNNAEALLAELRRTKSRHDDIYERAVGSLIAKYRYVPVRYRGMWQPVKYPWHLLPLLEQLLMPLQRQIDKTAQIHASAVIEGAVVLGRHARILPNAVVIGPCIIADDAIIGNNALVRRSSIGPRCVIGFNTEVKGSVLGSDVWTHSTYIGDSVVGSNVAFGSGSVTGNFRLDEDEVPSQLQGERLRTGLTKFGAIVGDGVRIGIHVGLLPGVKVGGNSFVSAGTLVDADIPDGQFAKMKNGHMTLTKNRAQVKGAVAREMYRKKM